jgi:hypothetical protein
MMNTCRLLALTLLWPFTASADWQYTTWGMTPEQVQKASKGVAVETTAKELKDNSPAGGGYTAKLTAPYKTDAFQFKAWFIFDKEDKLSQVTLDLVGGNPYSAIALLRNKYGLPASDMSGRVPGFEFWGWRLPTDQILVTFTDDGKSLGIMYSPP